MDIITAYNEMVHITLSASSVSQGTDALLDYIEQVKPSKTWAKLRYLNYQDDILALRGWMKNVLTTEPPAANVKGFWFGIFNPIVNRKVSCAFYLSGPTEVYAPDKIDWACWTDGMYLPQARYAPSNVLDVLYKTVRRVKSEEPLGEYILCLGYVCLMAADFARSIDPRLLLGDTDARPVVVGFDAGDDVFCGTLKTTGWEPANLLTPIR